MASLHRPRAGFTLIELLVVIAIIAILAVVVVLTLNPAQLLAESRDANRVSDMATLQSALNLYTTDQAGASSFSLGTITNTYISVPDSSSTCGDLGMPSLGSGNWACSTSANYRLATSTGWIGVNFNLISSGSPFGSLPVDPVNQTSSGLFYAYNTNGSQFEVTADLESTKYKAQYGNNPQTSLFPEVVSGGTPTVSALYNPSGLVGYWPLNEGVGSSTYDRSGYNDTGTFTGSAETWTSGKLGGSGLNLAGVSAVYYATSTAAPYPSTNVTVSIWVNVGTIASYEDLYAYNSPGVGNYILYFAASGAKWAIVSSGGTQYTASCTPAAGQWHLITGTYDGNNVLLYVDGALCGTASAAGITFLAPPTSPYINITSASGNMTVNDLRLYNRVLSAAEIKALYNAEK